MSRGAILRAAAQCSFSYVFAACQCPAERCSLAADTMAHPRFRGPNAAHRTVHSCRAPDRYAAFQAVEAPQDLFCRVRARAKGKYTSPKPSSRSF
jgi:hypothetical protein